MHLRVWQNQESAPTAVVQTGTGVVKYIQRQLDQDIHASVKDSEYVSAIHENAEKFDPRVEEVFKYIQVKTWVS